MITLYEKYKNYLWARRCNKKVTYQNVNIFFRYKTQNHRPLTNVSSKFVAFVGEKSTYNENAIFL